MISDFIIIERDSKIPLYNQIFLQIKNAIESGSLKENEKIPSVRKLCSDLEVSKTTVEYAYNMLCSQGYIINKPQSGYYVEKGLVIEKALRIDNEPEESAEIYKYDFSGNGIDNNCSNIREWRKYVKDILNREYLLNTYSENQGERQLRDTIQKYAFMTRGVNTDSDNIIIGSGSQTLIYILCGIFGVNKTVAIEKNTFPQAEQVFRDFNYTIHYISSDKKGIRADELTRIKPDILLINPNYNAESGKAMPVTRKLELINAAQACGCTILEDDYNGELRYRTTPTVCLQSYGAEQTVYIGSFSKILLPSVRISFMALPKNLKSQYDKVKNNYNQTTSKVEQLALAEYISDGKLEKHLRKSRRYYKTKSETFEKLLKKCFKDVLFNETGMTFEIRVNNIDAVKKLNENGVRPMNTSTDNIIRLNISQISEESFAEGIQIMKKALNSK